MCNGKFRAAADDKFAAVHSNIFRVLGARGARDYLDRRAPEGDVPLPLHIHKSFVDRATNPYPTGHRLLVFPFFSPRVVVLSARFLARISRAPTVRISIYALDAGAIFLYVALFAPGFPAIADN